MRDLLKIYLNLNGIWYLSFIIVFSILLVYLQQECIIIPQVDDQMILSDILKKQMIDQVEKYRWLSFLLVSIILLLRVLLVGGCLFIGFLFFENMPKTDYYSCFNISLKADIILFMLPVLYIAFSLFDIEFGLKMVEYTSLIFLFDINTIELWLITLIGMMNLFELLYMLFLAKLIAVKINITYIESFNFVLSTYGVGFVLYAMFLVFVMLYAN